MLGGILKKLPLVSKNNMNTPYGILDPKKQWFVTKRKIWHLCTEQKQTKKSLKENF